MFDKKKEENKFIKYFFYFIKGGSIFARKKLKGIDGRAPPGVELAA